MASLLKRRFERSYQVFRLQQCALLNKDAARDGQATGRELAEEAQEGHLSADTNNSSQCEHISGQDKANETGVAGRPDDETTETIENTCEGRRHRQKSAKIKIKGKSKSKGKVDRKWNAINSMLAIKFKLLMFVLATVSMLLHQSPSVRAGFFTFYFPNLIKPKGFGELTDMIVSLDKNLAEIHDTFSDVQYFWGQMQLLDSIPSVYPEESACTDVFPLFRDLAIEYVYIDYAHHTKPFELFKKALSDSRDKWYPLGLESRAALPRKWEQELLEQELKLKIEWLDKLINNDHHRKLRDRLVEIWRNVRRSLDTSLPCIYLRYAYREMAEDINEVALNANLASMHDAMEYLKKAYKRIEKYAEQDERIIKDIEDELEMFNRLQIES